MWTGGVRAATVAALACADSHGVRFAHAGHLLRGLLSDEGNRAVAALEDVGASTQWVLARQTSRDYQMEGTPHSTGVSVLEVNGQIKGRRKTVKRIAQMVNRAQTAGWRWGGFEPIVVAVDAEASRQAARCDTGQVSQVHYLLAILVLHDRLERRRITLVDDLARHNDAGLLLTRSGITPRAIEGHAANVIDEPAVGSSRPWRKRIPPYLPFGSSVVDLDERAHAYAADRGHRHVGTSHILLSILADNDGIARNLLHRLGVDTEAMNRELLARLDFSSAVR